MIYLFHGTITPFDNIDVTKGKGFKDFGKGFYCSDMLKHSASLACRNKSGRNKTGYVYKYAFDIAEFKEFNIKYFQCANLEWFDFILTNRQNSTTKHVYDIVIGPTADDNTNQVLSAYQHGLYGEVGSLLAKETAVRLLLSYKLATQYFFATDEAAQRLEAHGRQVIYV